MSTKNWNNKKPMKEEDSKNGLIWDVEKRGTPTCCICFEIALNPVRIPCRCATLMCLDCFKTFMDGYSACLVCRERIVPRLRRLCKGNGLESLVDVELQAWIRLNCPLGNQNDDENSKHPQSNINCLLTATRFDLKPPDPGELKQELERLNSRFEKERDEENKASLALIEELKRSGDDDLLELERLKNDEEMALKLQGFAHQVTEGGKEVITIIDEDDDNDVNHTASSSNTQASLKRSQSMSSSPNIKIDSKRSKTMNDGEIVTIKRSLTADPIMTSSSSLLLSSGKHSSSSSAAAHHPLYEVVNKDDDQRDNQNKGDDCSNKKTWICQVCTYAFTEKCWLRCEMCKSPKHTFS